MESLLISMKLAGIGRCSVMPIEEPPHIVEMDEGKGGEAVIVLIGVAAAAKVAQSVGAGARYG